MAKENNEQMIIKLKIKNKDGEKELKQFKSDDDLDGTLIDDITDVQYGVDEALNSGDATAVKMALRKRYELIADVIFAKQFTADEYVRGLSPKETMKLTNHIMLSFMGTQEETYASEKKK